MMDIEQFEKLATAAGLSLLSRWSPKFLVSLRVQKSYGTRIQTAKIEFLSQQSFEAATVEQCQEAIHLTKTRLENIAATQQGDLKNGTVMVKIAQPIGQPLGINYPPH